MHWSKCSRRNISQIEAREFCDAKRQEPKRHVLHSKNKNLKFSKAMNALCGKAGLTFNKPLLCKSADLFQ